MRIVFYVSCGIFFLFGSLNIVLNRAYIAAAKEEGMSVHEAYSHIYGFIRIKIFEIYLAAQAAYSVIWWLIEEYIESKSLRM